MFVIINTYLNQTNEVRHELQDSAGRVVNLGEGAIEDLIADLREAQVKGEELKIKLDAAAE